MKFIKHFASKDLIISEKLKLKDRYIGVMNGSFVLTSKELENLILVASKIWKHLLEVTETKKFLGLVRFDLVPKFEVSETEKNGEIDLGPLFIGGIYEINTHSPECACAVSVLHQAIPELTSYQPSASQRLVKAIFDTFGSQEIAFVVGKGPVKEAWVDIFYGELCRLGLHLNQMTPQEVVKNSPSIIWRWGDARIQGYTEYDLWFIEYLIASQNKGTIVFNTLPIGKWDISNKGLLRPIGVPEWDSLVGTNKFLSKEVFTWGIRHRDNLVLKPLMGSSGRGIIFGRLCSPEEWKIILESALNSSEPFGLYEAKWLPKIRIGEKYYAIDINVAFWAVDQNLRYLYSVIRLDEWERYWKRGTINVTQGAAFAGTVVEE